MTLPASVPERDNFLSATGCQVDTLLYRPEHPRTEALVVLAHGFLRNQDRMAGLAQALAAAGIPTATLSLCSSRLLDGRHITNGVDMRRLAGRLHARQVVYAGFSSGGLAALVAGRLDPNTRGILTLDLVDAGGIGTGIARKLDKPLLGLVGEPAACNSYNNGLAVFAASPQAQLTRVSGASHCDFESPSDWLCELVCDGPGFGSEMRRRTIIDRSVAAVVGLLGLEPGAGAR